MQIIEFLKSQTKSLQSTNGVSIKQSPVVSELHRTGKLLDSMPELLISQLEEARTQEIEKVDNSLS